jgi:hypothetical protein|tara:strand:+ start:2560 stop:2799 length:240 start_codon:yes stop_codon:yes gene_type:complete
MLKKEQKRKQKSLSPKEILDEAFSFAANYPNDPMALSASLMVVAKTIYLNILGPEQTQMMMDAFVNGIDNYEVKTATLH